MRVRFLLSALSLVAGIGLATQVDAATITATPNSGSSPGAVSIEMVFGGSEGPQGFQLSLNLVDTVGNATTGAGVFTVTLTTGPTAEPFDSWQIPASSLNAGPGTGNVFAAGADIFGPKATGLTIEAFEIVLAGNGPSGILTLVIDSASSFWSPDGVTQNAFATTGTIGTFEVSAVIPEPGSMLLMGAGLAVVGLVARKWHS